MIAHHHTCLCSRHSSAKCCVVDTILKVAMEAHDGEGRLEVILRILREDAKYQHVTVEQSDMLKGSSLHNIYCTR